MNDHFKRIRRVLTCNIETLTPAEGKELTDLISKKVKAITDDAKAKTKPRSGGGDTGASA